MLIIILPISYRFINDRQGFVLGNDGVLLKYLGWSDGMQSVTTFFFICRDECMWQNGRVRLTRIDFLSSILFNSFKLNYHNKYLFFRKKKNHLEGFVHFRYIWVLNLFPFDLTFKIYSFDPFTMKYNQSCPITYNWAAWV